MSIMGKKNWSSWLKECKLFLGRSPVQIDFIITAMYTEEFKVKLMNYIYPQVQLVDVLCKPLDYVSFFHAVNKALDPKKILV
jgi:hypothetical protein